MMLYSIFLFCFVAITAVGCAEIGSRNWDIKSMKIKKGDKVDLKLYYESLCPYCVRFHVERLDPTLKKIGSYIDLKVYPYGNAERHERNGKTVIICQHGEKECYGNKLHACAIDILKDIYVAEPYISCMMNATWGGDGSTDKDATQCGDLMKIDSKPIKECAKSKKGEELLEYYGKESEKVNFDGVPYVLINDKEFDLSDDLKKTICDALKNPPPQCKE
ncbi:GILT-like protein 2 [Cydia pomonella]|uniref:GILT-like protein 2 n=1 Tax=Cydia pomonella TaxID=82600 RepID=UPI002ADDAB6E|nr:GILT-like protein 2 [Cydia pomonella]